MSRRLGFSAGFSRRIIMFILLATMLFSLLPSAVAQTLVRNAAQQSLGFADNSLASSNFWSQKFIGLSLAVISPVLGSTTAVYLSQESDDRARMPSKPNAGTGVKSRAVASVTERESEVATLRIQPAGEVVMQSDQQILLVALPENSEGNVVHGVKAEWQSSDKTVVRVKRNGEATAGRAGSATLTARLGQISETVTVTVVSSERKFGQKKMDSTRADRELGLSTSSPPYRNTPDRDSLSSRVFAKSHHAARSKSMTGGMSPMPLRPPGDDPLPDTETASLYQSDNATGAPLGMKKLGSTTPAAATEGTENGNKNFTFSLPIFNLPGRGISAGLSLVYNSLVWNKSTSGSNTYVTYDVDSGWPGPGFRLGFGQIEDQGSYGLTLTEPDGTRHGLFAISTWEYETRDGSFLHYSGDASLGTLFYPDGTRIRYGAGGGGYRIYPTSMVDRNGNYILISYVSSVGPKISTIQDTLERYVQFNYDSNGDLVAITQPGFNGSGTPLQVMRFYYKSTDISLTQSGLWGSGITPSLPASNSAHVLEYVYLPASSESGGAHLGYKFEYSPYGMIYRSTQYRGMTVSTTSLTSAGSVTATGSQAAVTEYNYPTSPSGLTDVPAYTTRTDDWAGRTTTSTPQYAFANSTATNEKISKVTAPDGTVTETHSNDLPGQWNDGLVIETDVGYMSGGSMVVLSRTRVDWDSTSTTIPRIAQVRQTDVAAGFTKATVMSYTSYNNVSAVSERAFTTDGSVSSTELRRTETTYVTATGYINQHLLQLPLTVKVFPGGSSTPASRVDYEYDNYGTSHANMTPRADIVMHEDSFNPFCQAEGKCEYDCVSWKPNGLCSQWGWICPYSPQTDNRGNVTSVTTYSDAPNASGAITHSNTYDVAGNITSTQVDCCQLKVFTYITGNHYAYPSSVTSGNPSGVNVTTSATYDLNTGLISTATDENGQVTTNYYNADSLRLNHIQYPSGGGSSYYYYGDGLMADAAGNNHYYTVVSREIAATGTTANNWLDVYSFLDGRGAVSQMFYNGTGGGPWTSYVLRYDEMGRPVLKTNPFSTGGYGGGLHVGGSDPVTTTVYDHLGRVTSVTAPSGDDTNPTTTQASMTYDGVYTTITDAANKVRRQKVDELGRVVRLDEPTTSGLGSVTSPNQANSYEYDALDNLIHVTQGAQERFFKYDSLSRLTYDRQVEQAAPWTTSDYVAGNNAWSRKMIYNASGLMTDSYDARQIHTTLSYDDLNRVTLLTYSDSTPTVHYYYDSQTLPSGAPSSGDGYSRGYSTGRLVATTYGSGATGNYYGYDNNGLITTQFQVTGSGPTKYKLGYGYNLGGMLTSETYPSNRTISYTYTYGGRLASISDGTNTFASSLNFGSHGGLTSETWGNGAVHTRSYDRSLHLSQIKLALSGVVQQQYDYSYGVFNTSTGAVDTTKNNGQLGSVKATIGTTAQWMQGFSYDELNRLSNVAEYQSANMGTQTFSQGYTYDRFGNRAQSANSTLGLGAISLSEYDAGTNRFIATGSTPTTYDASGNITNDTKFRGLSYTYDANGRQTSASNGGWTQNQTYDAEGRRVQTTVSGATRNKVYDIFGQAVADYSGSGTTLERENIYRGGLLLATYEAASSAIKYVLQDHQGSTRVLMNNSGVVARHDYLPFGEEIGAGVGLRTTGQTYNATDTNRQKYGLTERDDSSGLDHTPWRKLDSLSGRWTSPDPYSGSMEVANPQTFNRYAYVQNDPVNFVDPLGLMCFNVWLVTTTRITYSDGSVSTSTTWEYQYSFCFMSGGWTRTRLPKDPPRPKGNDQRSAPSTDFMARFQKAYDDCIATRKAERERMRANRMPESLVKGGIKGAKAGVDAAVGTFGALKVKKYGLEILLNADKALPIADARLAFIIGGSVGEGVMLHQVGSDYFRGAFELPSQLEEHAAADKSECEKKAANVVGNTLH
jgi:RHS repeat-associated protein